MSFLIGSLSFVLLSVSLFMILLVLIQRGRGGGLAGAFGGMGGQSAFGTRAGDTFTRITVVLAVVWVLLAGGIGMLMRRDAEASRTGANSAFAGGKEADDKKGDGNTEGTGSVAGEGDAKTESGRSDEFVIDKDGDKSKATATLPDEKKSDDAVPAKAESGEAEKTTPEVKSTPPAEVPDDTPDASDKKGADASDEKASAEKPVESEASKEANPEPAAPDKTPATSDPKP